jgi:hypothetical protein
MVSIDTYQRALLGLEFEVDTARPAIRSWMTGQPHRFPALLNSAPSLSLPVAEQKTARLRFCGSFLRLPPRLAP